MLRISLNLETKFEFENWWRLHCETLVKSFIM